MFGESTIFKCLAEKIWRMNRSAKGLSMLTVNLDGFSLVKHRRFAKFAKLSPHKLFHYTVNYIEQILISQTRVFILLSLYIIISISINMKDSNDMFNSHNSCIYFITQFFINYYFMSMLILLHSNSFIICSVKFNNRNAVASHFLYVIDMKIQHNHYENK